MIALRVLHAFGPEIGTAARQGDSHVLVSVDDGTVLDDPEFGGADFLVAYATVALPTKPRDSPAPADEPLSVSMPGLADQTEPRPPAVTG